MPLDLRNYDSTREIEKVERALGVGLDRRMEARKRRSVGLRSYRDTWVRIKQRSMPRFTERGTTDLNNPRSCMVSPNRRDTRACRGLITPTIASGAPTKLNLSDLDM
jgi:hypothetical protein